MADITASKKELSCALIIRSPKGWLLCKATGSERWDFPKGRIEPGETPLQAAVRECREECGVDLSGQTASIREFGRLPYMPKKDLHVFYWDDEAGSVDPANCSCSSFVEIPGRAPFPETCAFEFVPPEAAAARTGKSLAKLIVEILAPALGAFGSTAALPHPEDAAFLSELAKDPQCAVDWAVSAFNFGSEAARRRALFVADNPAPELPFEIGSELWNLRAEALLAGHPRPALRTLGCGPDGLLAVARFLGNTRIRSQAPAAALFEVESAVADFPETRPWLAACSPTLQAELLRDAHRPGPANSPWRRTLLETCSDEAFFDALAVEGLFRDPDLELSPDAVASAFKRFILSPALSENRQRRPILLSAVEKAFGGLERPVLGKAAPQFSDSVRAALLEALFKAPAEALPPALDKLRRSPSALAGLATEAFCCGQMDSAMAACRALAQIDPAARPSPTVSFMGGPAKRRDFRARLVWPPQTRYVPGPLKTAGASILVQTPMQAACSMADKPRLLELLALGFKMPAQKTLLELESLAQASCAEARIALAGFNVASLRAEPTEDPFDAAAGMRALREELAVEAAIGTARTPRSRGL